MFLHFCCVNQNTKLLAVYAFKLILKTLSFLFLYFYSECFLSDKPLLRISLICRTLTEKMLNIFVYSPFISMRFFCFSSFVKSSFFFYLFFSESVMKLVALAYETLSEAVSSSDPCAVKLFYAVRNMFELFCCVFPTFHKRRLATLPQLTGILILEAFKTSWNYFISILMFLK